MGINRKMKANSFKQWLLESEDFSITRGELMDRGLDSGFSYAEWHPASKIDGSRVGEFKFFIYNDDGEEFQDSEGFPIPEENYPIQISQKFSIGVGFNVDWTGLPQALEDFQRGEISEDEFRDRIWLQIPKVAKRLISNLNWNWPAHNIKAIKNMKTGEWASIK